MLSSEKLKKLLSNKYSLIALVIIPVIIILILYFRAFYSTGTFFYDKFLKKEVINAEIHYINKSADIHIIVERSDDNNATVTYNLPENLSKEFYVNYSKINDQEFKINSIKNKNDIMLFEGIYRKNSILLHDKNGDPIFDSASLGFTVGNYDNYNDISPLSVLNFTFSTKDMIRGDYEPLMMAILLFLLTFVDIKYPLFFFTLNHFLDVKDPEPTDFYISMQKIGWFVMPIIGILLMILAI